YEPGSGGHHLLRGRYGDRFVPDPAGPVDKRALFAAMQADAALRREVEDMIHPLARHDMDAFFAQAEASGVPVAVAEVPLFLEAGWKAGTPPNTLPSILLVGVHCPFAERARRLETHRGWPPDMIAAMEAWQWPEADKMRACHLVVDNSGTPEDLARRTRGLLAELVRLRAARDARIADHLASLWQA
ncbi:dephospho-CoA kinase, partial [Nitratidesulfovibrio liaohensis]|uniref:dephospho-CoA kinase n=1 Tax=Nitratidesulfovibrio liaohensis TaxID=2604158 RepID=UPI0014243712